MPQIRNIDEAREEGAYLYTIGGHHWVAPEPSMDVIKEVVRIDAAAFATAANALQEQVNVAGYDAKSDRATDTLAGVDALMPQLQLVLFAANEAGVYVGGKYTKPKAAAAGATAGPGTWEPGAVVEAGARVPIPTEYAKHYLSAKRAGAILAEVLGEGGSQA